MTLSKFVGSKILLKQFWRPSGRDHGSWIYNYLCNQCKSCSGKAYFIQHYVMKFVSDLRAVLWFSPGTLVSCTNKTDFHDITKILLKVALTHHNPNSNPILKQI